MASIKSLKSAIQHSLDEIATIHSKISREHKKMSGLFRKIRDVNNAINRTKSPSTKSARLNDLERIHTQIARSEKRIALLQERLASEHTALSRAKERLVQEENKAL